MLRHFELFVLAVLLFTSCKRPPYKSGEAVYEGACLKCHKLNGRGGTKGPDLTTIFRKKDEGYIRTAIVEPRAVKPDGTMPPSKLSDHELDMLIQYLKEQTAHR